MKISDSFQSSVNIYIRFRKYLYIKENESE